MDHSSSRPRWGAVLALSLAAFALVASEFMPVSLLSPLAADLNISEGQAGQGISVSGLFALLTSLVIANVAARVDRKRLLIALTLLMILSGTVVALAPNYGVFMLGRALIGVAIGGFWSLSAATAMRLVPTPQVPRALAIVNGGNALATVIAAPLGSFVGGLIGWRGAFFCVVPVAIVAVAWLLISLPSIKPRAEGASANGLRLMNHRPVALGMLAVSVFFMGQFMLFTYLRPFLEGVTRASVSTLSLMLLVLGLAGLAGTFLIERFLKNHLYATLTVIPVLMALTAVALVAFGGSSLITAMLLGVWGLVATAAPVGWWTWLAKVLPDDAEAGGGLMVAIIQLAIALGAIVGGWVFDLSGYRATFESSAAVLSAAALLAWLAGRASHYRALSMICPPSGVRL
ncbi:MULTISPECIES: MFS transporter [unclassified Pseudomonas]|jgi:predicted MFS family arabinose efflux permease|uniref:Transcriptional regulator n=1 Tax=Pseudomonas gorinensis TaxID=3240790 RepID=A0ACA7P878_9PSED|nr:MULTISPECIES: MFS transporter [unclassified Pseudomonas]AHC36201.1 transcriptional regulator [Pseudomonas sp. TKP]MBL1305723.1 MFS transporter [Pseudomonas sp.]PMX06516.1 MFS transporter [Pseudomonas sp. MPBC4-3]PMX41519.1 MFS transporter [Pseudomonas sp. FW301-21B01]PMY02584.1 MFS transporter [Pseudomonas sp. MPR-R5A]